MAGMGILLGMPKMRLWRDSVYAKTKTNKLIDRQKSKIPVTHLLAAGVGGLKWNMTKMQLEINKNVEIFYGKTNVPFEWR